MVQMNASQQDSILVKIGDWLGRGASVLILMIALFLILGVLTGLVGSRPYFLAEAAQLFSIWVVFLGILKSAMAEEDIRVTYFFDQLPARVRTVVETGRLIVSLFAVGVTLVSAVIITTRFAGATTASGLPFVLLYGPVALGMSTLALWYLSELIAVTGVR